MKNDDRQEFGISDEKKLELYHRGRASMLRYLERMMEPRVAYYIQEKAGENRVSRV